MSDVIDPLVNLDLAKAHLRIDHSDDNALIESYIAAATRAALDYCYRDTLPDVSAFPTWRAAVLLLVGDLYGFRETAQEGSVSSEIAMHPNARALLDPYRLLRV